MTFEHDERDDLWKMIEEVKNKAAKTPHERRKRDEAIQIIKKEIENVIDPDLCSWKNMFEFVVHTDPEKAAPVYESCIRAL